ncbi:MAG: DNA repair helicase XPB [Spirochaetia bacterium]|nr:DNA repair helicase XPB [Spirochaetia bacterium]
MLLSDFSKPLILQSDFSLLLDVHNPLFENARGEIAAFAELEKSPEHIHTYRITPLSLWNAASAGLKTDAILETLNRYSRFPVPQTMRVYIESTISKFGKVILTDSPYDRKLELRIDDNNVRLELLSRKNIAQLIEEKDGKIYTSLLNRGRIKQELIYIGYPVEDKAALTDGDPLTLSLRTPTAASGKPFTVRDYQADAVKAFYRPNTPGTGYGVIVLPCGSGKTVVGINALNELQCAALILTTNIAAVHQWKEELLDKTTLTADQIGEYSGAVKEIKDVTIATYQILTWRGSNKEEFPHFSVFMQRKWGLIIYDEVHLLPAPVFRITAEIQAMRRLGLTATLIREDGLEKDVFSLVGPKRYDVPWKDLEQQGWIASACCREIRIDLPEEDQIRYAVADKRSKYRIASENRRKIDRVKKLISLHKDDSIIIIGQYISQLEAVAEAVGAPLITGQTPTALREELYRRFKSGEEKIIIVSKVANFAIDLPDASVAIQISGTFGSRQEEAQRLGRILRPKKKEAVFYSLVTNGTTEEIFAANRQKFLIEQGYKYSLEFDD